MNLPNIVIFFADNLGYNDIGPFNSNSSPTPNINQLAKEGMKLNNWNSAAALCSASRAALLTGKYPVRTGVYPGVFKPGAANGLMPEEVTIAEYLKEEKDYATSIVGKWHLGHREDYLPLNQGFDEWFGIPYHMSGGSIDEHLCGFDVNETMWLPLFEGTRIVEQPVDLTNLAQRYADKARQFIRQSVGAAKSFFLYVPFSHVHQLCAPQQSSCQWASTQFSSRRSPNATFTDAVEEMDWIAGEILSQLDESNVQNDTLVLFTSDNGPWLAEKSCSGSKGPFEGRWLRENVDIECTACPHDFIPSPTEERPRRCTLQGFDDKYQIDGIHCGEDVGLGSCWEANIRMPAIARWPGKIAKSSITNQMVSTLDVLPTILKLTSIEIPSNLDGIDISSILFGNETNETFGDRVLFFWRDGFSDGPLPQPFGRFDVVAVKIGRIKAWFYTKSSHYNLDAEVYHDPPILFDNISDEAEAYPLDPTKYKATIELIKTLVNEHKRTVDWQRPLTIAQDPVFVPCVDPDTQCRTESSGKHVKTKGSLWANWM